MVTWRAAFEGFLIALAVVAIVALVTVLLSACSVPRPTQKVEVPVAVPVYCEAPELGRPHLAIADLSDDSPPERVIPAYVASVSMLIGAVNARDAELTGCRKPGQGEATKP